MKLPWSILGGNIVIVTSRSKDLILSNTRTAGSDIILGNVVHMCLPAWIKTVLSTQILVCRQVSVSALRRKTNGDLTLELMTTFTTLSFPSFN